MRSMPLNCAGKDSEMVAFVFCIFYTIKTITVIWANALLLEKTLLMGTNGLDLEAMQRR